jgi:hypothetical protein
MTEKGDDYPYEDIDGEWLPGPVQVWVRDLTYNEIHAMELGFVGFMAGAGLRAGFTEAVAAFTIAVAGLAFGLRKAPDDAPVAQRVIKREPYYFLVVYVLSVALVLLAPPVVL